MPGMNENYSQHRLNRSDHNFLVGSVIASTATVQHIDQVQFQATPSV